MTLVREREVLGRRVRVEVGCDGDGGLWLVAATRDEGEEVRGMMREEMREIRATVLKVIAAGVEMVVVEEQVVPGRGVAWVWRGRADEKKCESFYGGALRVRLAALEEERERLKEIEERVKR